MLGHLSARLRALLPLLLLLLLLRGIEESAAQDEDSLEKCCDLGSSWADQKLRCERFTGPVAGVSEDEQPACLEAVDICCRRAFEEQGCEQGKTDAKAGRACDGVEDELKGTPLGNYRRDCCEACKLGILTGSSGKSCAFKKFRLGIPWDPAFMECCKDSKTTSTSSTSTMTSPSTSASTSSTADDTPTEIDDLDDFLEDLTSPMSTFNSDDLCQLMKGLLCSEICVPTPGSYYCKCHEGSVLQADGRSCVSNVTTTTTITTTTQATTTISSTAKPTTEVKSTSPSNATASTVLTTPPLTTIPSKKASTKSPKKATTSTPKPTTLSLKAKTKVAKWTTKPLSKLDKISSIAKSRTTRSLPSEDNELNQACPSGYRFNPKSQVCDDIDECKEEPASALCPAGSGCLNANGTYRCVLVPGHGNGTSCLAGYRWNATLARCADVDECLENIHKCLKESEICRNLEGSYVCEIKCEAGFVFSGNHGACLDVNECSEYANVCPQADTICVNSIGSYECKNLREYQQFVDPNQNGSWPEERRPTDYEGVDEGRDIICASGLTYNTDMRTCEDIDECQVHRQPCAPGELCRNTPGGYDCIPAGCPRGFVLAEDVCQDVDECEQGLHSCAPHERCQNTNGSFTCEPPRPTRRPATTESPRIICRKGYKPDNKTGSCVDVDECVEGPGCRDFERCSNVQGSYDCSPLCGPGWYFQLQTKTCQDVDECLLGHHNCRRTHYCRNTNGSFICEPLTACLPGYRRAQNGSCIDVDECLESLHQCSRDSHRYCVNREGGYECITRLPSCSRGFEYSLLTRQCEDVDECRSGRASCDSRLNERCVNLPGSYRCERPDLRLQRRRPACPSGYSYDIQLRRCEPISGKEADARASSAGRQ